MFSLPFRRRCALRLVMAAGLVLGFVLTAAHTLARADPYRALTPFEMDRPMVASRPFHHYRPRVRVRGAPEVNVERLPPSRALTTVPRSRRQVKPAKSRCFLQSRPTRPGSSVRVYSRSRNCD